MIHRKHALALTILLATAAACGPGGKKPLPEDFSDLAGVHSKSDKFSSKLLMLGDLHYGKVRRHAYSGTPRYRGYRVESGWGERVEVWVRSSDGDPVAWITDDRFRVIARNDDAGEDTYDSFLHATIGDPDDESGRTIYVLFTEYSQAPAQFRVLLSDDVPQHGSDDGDPVDDWGCLSDGRELGPYESYRDGDCNVCTCYPEGVSCSPGECL